MKTTIPSATLLSLAFAACATAQTLDSHSTTTAATMPAQLRAAIHAAADSDADAHPQDAPPWTAQILSEDDGVADDRFGTAVAVSGDTAVIASAVWSYNRESRANAGVAPTSVEANQRGAIYIFLRRNGVWTQTQKLFASDAADYMTFGSAIALEGSTLLVAALNANVGDASQQGAVYAFARSGDTWAQTQKISSSDGESIDAFGSAIALHGTTAVIGALDGHPNGNSMQGKAYVFTLADGLWSERQILVADDGASNDRFGQTAAFDGSTILIGAPTLPYNFNHGGAVYAFEESNGSWTQTAKIVPDDSAVSDQFGYAIGLSSGSALISSIGNQFAHGALYAFDHAGTAWTQTQKLTPSDSASGDQFGNALAVQGDTVLVGAQSMVSGDQKGAAYVIERTDGTWGEPVKLVQDDAGSLDLFGSATAYDGTTMLVGAPGATVADRASQGTVYFYSAPVADEIFCSGFESSESCGSAARKPVD